MKDLTSALLWVLVCYAVVQFPEVQTFYTIIMLGTLLVIFPP